MHSGAAGWRQHLNQFGHWSKCGYAIAYCALIAVSVVLPSAKVAGLNVKIPLAISLVCLGSRAWLNALREVEPVGRFTKRYAIAFTAFAAILAYWSLLGIQNGFMPTGELRSMLAPLIVIGAYHPYLVSRRAVLLTYVASVAFYVVIKLSLVTAIDVGLLAEADLVAFGHRLFEMQFVGGPTCTPGLRRLTMVNDLAVAIFPLLLLDGRLRTVATYTLLALCGLAVFATYSRYLTLLFMAMCLIVAWRVPNARGSLAASLAMALLVAFAAGGGSCLAGRLSPFTKTTEAAKIAGAGGTSDNRSADRLDRSESVNEYPDAGSLNLHTDNIRREQFRHLARMVTEKPLQGHGIGSYDPTYVRSREMPYSYELQLLALLMKFGLVGFALLALGAATVCWLHFGTQWPAWVAATALIGSGLGNPFYESTAFGVAFVVIAAAFRCQVRQ